MNALADLKQRADYTHKHNVRSGRHGWVRLTPAYSVKVVEEILANHKQDGRVFDPFCGSGTTALCAARLGLDATTTDINPFLIWLTRAKTRNYTTVEATTARDATATILDGIGSAWRPALPPEIHRIERWWPDDSLKFLCDLKGAIDGVDISSRIRDLLLVAFCRTAIGVSNAAFNHQSISFKERDLQLDLEPDRRAVFKADVERILTGCREKIRATPEVLLQDARCLDRKALGAFDLVITSPPYANRMSYVRELRPYMYWLGHLRKAQEAGELDWQAIGGTWGVATSRLLKWTASGEFHNAHLDAVATTIESSHNKHATTLSRYIQKYCEDIFHHFTTLATVLQGGAHVHYIVGNSTFYGTLVKVEEIYADIMRKAGFSDIEIRPIRKRNSNKKLVEFDVSAVWP